MRVYKSAWFDKFSRKERISDAKLCEAVRLVEQGLADADLGGGLIKQRIAREGAGKSGGFRTLIFSLWIARHFRIRVREERKVDLDVRELAMFKKAAKIALELAQAQIDFEVEAGRMTEVNCGDKNL